MLKNFGSAHGLVARLYRYTLVAEKDSSLSIMSKLFSGPIGLARWH